MRVSISIFSVLALVVSVSGLNLNDIAPLSTANVTPGCLSTYSTAIPACPDSSDFQAKTAVCTSACTAALTTAQQAVILSCRQASVSPDGLLRQLLNGNLVSTLCPAPASSSVVSSSVVSSSAVSSKPSATPSASRLELTGFLTMTIPPPSSTGSDVPDELTLDDSVAPTVSSDDVLSVPTQASPSVPVAAAENTEVGATRTPFNSYAMGAPTEKTGGAGRTGGAVVLMVLMAAAAAVVVM